jgi:hypothetical protein
MWITPSSNAPIKLRPVTLAGIHPMTANRAVVPVIQATLEVKVVNVKLNSSLDSPFRAKIQTSSM